VGGHPPGQRRGQHGVVVDLQDPRDGAVGLGLVAAGEVPDDWHPEVDEGVEHYLVAPLQLVGRQKAAEGSRTWGSAPDW